MDLTRYPLPLRAFIGGKFVDSVGDDKKELRSSVDDRVVTDGLYFFPCNLLVLTDGDYC